MNELQSSVYNSCLTIADELEIKQLSSTLSKDITFLKDDEKLNIAIIGQPFNGLLEILYGLLKTEPFISKAAQKADKSYKIKVKFAEDFSFKILNKDREYVPFSKEEFERKMCEVTDDFASEVLCAEIGVNLSSLKETDITLICSKNNFEDFNWISEFTKADFCFFVASAVSLFSLAEKSFLRGPVSNLLGDKRTGIVVNNFNLVDGNGKNEVKESVEYFLSDKEIKPPVFYYSSYQVLCSQLNNSPVEEKNQELIDFIQNKLIKYASSWRESNTKQSLMICINEIKKSVTGLRSNLAIDTDKIDSAISELNYKMKHIEDSKKSTKRKIEMYLNGSVRIAFIDKMNTFNDLVKKDIGECILKNDDLEKYKKLLPEYIEHMWSDFFKHEQPWLSRQIQQEMLDISRDIENEISKVVSSAIEDEVGNLIVSCLSSKYNSNLQYDYSKSDHWASALSKYLSIGGIALFLVNIPLAIAAVGSSQVLKYFYRDDIENDRKEKFVSNVSIKCDKLLEEIVSQVNSQFDSIIEDLKDKADKAYDEIFKSLVQSLNEQKESIKQTKDRLLYIDHLEDSIIPGLINDIKEVKMNDNQPKL